MRFHQRIPPAIAIEQKVSSRNPRSTVGTSTEIYEYLRCSTHVWDGLFSPVSGQEEETLHRRYREVHAGISGRNTLYRAHPDIAARRRTLQQQLEIDMNARFHPSGSER